MGDSALESQLAKVAQILTAETELLEACNWDEERCSLILETATQSIVSVHRSHNQEISSKPVFEDKLLEHMRKNIPVTEIEFRALIGWIESGLIFRMSDTDIKEILTEGISSIYENEENE